MPSTRTATRSACSVALSVPAPRTAEADAAGGDPTGPTALPGHSREIRLVLEANVRSTQLAFQHNPRMLEVGLRMAETLRDAVQILARSQADWIRSAVSVRALAANGGSVVPTEAADAPADPCASADHSACGGVIDRSA